MSKADMGFLSQCHEEVDEVLSVLDILKSQRQEQLDELKKNYVGRPDYKEFQQLCDRYIKALQWYEELKTLIGELLSPQQSQTLSTDSQVQAERASFEKPTVVSPVEDQSANLKYNFKLADWLRRSSEGYKTKESPWGFIFLRESKKKITISLKGGSSARRFCVISPVLEAEYLNKVFSNIEYEDLKDKELDCLYKYSPTVDFLSVELMKLSHNRWDTELMTMLIDKMFIECEPEFVVKALDRFVIQQDYKGHDKAVEQLREALVPQKEKESKKKE